jgi:two-component sensor histidine kinase
MWNQEAVMTQLTLEESGSDEQVLLHELTHRINNEFAAIIGAVSLAATRSGNAEVKGALSRVAELLNQYAGVHRALQMPEYDTLVDAEAYFRQLCLSIGRSKLDNRQIKLVLSAQSLRLRAKRCWLLGMIVCELITNAARHAFAGDGGEIHVAVWRDGAFVKCSVKDNGSAATNIQPGRGLKIVEGLSGALEGCFEQKFGPRGSRSLLVFPYRGEPGFIVERTRQAMVDEEYRYGVAQN